VAKKQETPEIVQDRRVVDRARLRQVLDGAGPRTVIIIGAAGYGKTTLLRQWAPTTNAVTYTVTAADMDVAALVRHLASSFFGQSSHAISRLEELLAVVQHPARSPDDIASALLDAPTGENAVTSIVVDEYERIAGSASAERVVELLHESQRFKLVVASRVRPGWATARRFIYDELIEVGADQLALTEAEVAEVMGAATAPQDVFAQARGWPAVIALLASATVAAKPPAAVTPMLYSFVAGEVFNSTTTDVQAALFDLALQPGPVHVTEAIERHVSDDVLASAVATGLAHVEDDRVTLHPLARSFLLETMRTDQSERPRIVTAISDALTTRHWDTAFSLIRSFGMGEAIEQLMTDSFRELLSVGRIATLQAFAHSATEEFGLSLPIVELVEAEVAFRDGRLDAARSLAGSAEKRLTQRHSLAARAQILGGLAALLRFDFEAALDLFQDAKSKTADHTEQIAALWGECQASIFLERPEMAVVAAEIATTAVTPEEHLRAAMSGLQIARYTGLRDVDRHASAIALLPHVRDPRTRTSFGAVCGYARVLQARYDEAAAIAANALADSAQFELAFARPHLRTLEAAAAFGLRDFSGADSALREVEEHAQKVDDLYIQLNSRALRARILLAQHRTEEAIAVLSSDWEAHSDRLMYGEYIATRALAMAVDGKADEALATAHAATETTAGIEARVTALATSAVVAIRKGEPDPAAMALFEAAVELDVWDILVTTFRAEPDVLKALAKHPQTHAQLATVLQRSHDQALGRRCGFGVELAYGRRDLLSKREHEVFDLLRQGLTNREIARSLFIAESTAKVHVHHILDKLNVRSRAEAVARYAETATRAVDDDEGTWRSRSS